MRIFPAIDLFDGKAVRLYKGDYSQMTVYSDNPQQIAADFYESGAKYMHLVDLEGARSGQTPNLDTIRSIVNSFDMFVEVGGGIRSLEVIEKYIGAGVDRIILGTADVTDRAFLCEAVKRYGEKIAVGVDIKDGYVAIKGWEEKSSLCAFDFCSELEKIGVNTIICTDISKDGAMLGANHELYERLARDYNMNVIASGGVSSIEDVKRLSKLGIYGAIIGKAYYTGSISLREAIAVGKNDN